MIGTTLGGPEPTTLRAGGFEFVNRAVARTLVGIRL